MKKSRKYLNAKCHLRVISRRGLVIRNVTSHLPFLHIPAYFDAKTKNQGTPLGQTLDFHDFNDFEVNRLDRPS